MGIPLVSGCDKDGFSFEVAIGAEGLHNNLEGRVTRAGGHNS